MVDIQQERPLGTNLETGLGLQGLENIDIDLIKTNICGVNLASDLKSKFDEEQSHKYWVFIKDDCFEIIVLEKTNLL